MFFIVSNVDAEDKPFNQIELSNNNTIVNNNFPKYYDTVLSVAMDQMGLSGYVVVLYDLTDNAKSQFDGELKAHIRYVNSNFYLFSEGFDRQESIDVLTHEVIHMQQYASGDLIYENDQVIWKNEQIDLESKEYERRPWENDAFEKGSQLSNTVKSILY